jgi:hypothetical protein
VVSCAHEIKEKRFRTLQAYSLQSVARELGSCDKHLVTLQKIRWDKSDNETAGDYEGKVKVK